MDDNHIEGYFVKLYEEIDALRARVSEFEHPTPCKWKHDPDGYWEGECGGAWSFEDEGPTENDYHFCPKCGKPIELLPIEEEEWEEEE